MNILKVLYIAIVTCIVSSCSTVPVDEFTSLDNNEAILLMRGLPILSDYSLTFFNFDEKNQQLNLSILRVSASPKFLVGASNSRDPKFVYTTIPAGTYVFHSYIQDKYWSLCYSASSYSFTVKPGEILYFGTFNPIRHTLELQSEVRKDGAYVGTANRRHLYVGNFSAPELLMPKITDKEFEDAQAFISSIAPQKAGLLTLTDLKKASFGTGYNMFGKRACAGFLISDSTAKADL